jgi:hypothetical protein
MKMATNITFKRTRVVLTDAGGAVHPMLALSASKDGGLMLDLCKYAPFEHYRYGVVDVPSGEGSFEAKIRRDEASWAVGSVAPKLHYHRSGFISLNATERLERQGIQGTPIGAIGPGHRHAFSFIARHPFAWAPVPARKTDLVFTASRAPETITIAGHVGPATNLKPVDLPGNPAAMMMEQEDGRVVPTIVARFDSDAANYYVWIELHVDREFGSGDEPGLILYTFDPIDGADTTTPSAMVGVWSMSAAAYAAAA